jgi:drug/metabolite transporter (DMT)-like permease
MGSPVLAAIFALSAAATWGSGDFTGGLATRRVGPFYTVLVSYSVGLLALLGVALARSEPLPPAADLLWGALAGLLGMLGLGFLLRGFAAGRMGIVAPVSAVLGTAIPVLFAAFTQGLPARLQLLGFALALASIWLLSRPEKLDGRTAGQGGKPSGIDSALLAGLGFGGFFTALAQVGESAVFWPLVAGRLASCLAMVGFTLIVRRQIVKPGLPLGLLALAGALDVGGNLFFLLALQTGRLDIAAVLASLYPAVTALLAWLVGGERLARLQVAGVAGAVLAIVLITA